MRKKEKEEKEKETKKKEKEKKKGRGMGRERNNMGYQSSSTYHLEMIQPHLNETQFNLHGTQGQS